MKLLQPIQSAVNRTSSPVIASCIIAGALFVSTSLVVMQMRENRLQRQCHAYWDAIGAPKFEYFGGLERGDERATNRGRLLAEGLRLGDAHSGYCWFPSR